MLNKLLKIKKITPLLIILLVFIIIPSLALAQDNTSQNPLVPNCGENNECGYTHLIILVNNIIGWIVTISVPVAAGVIAWAGFVLMTSGDNAGKRSEAKSIMTKVFIGLAFILSAWIIVSTIVNALLGSSNSVYMPIQF